MKVAESTPIKPPPRQQPQAGCEDAWHRLYARRDVPKESVKQVDEDRSDGVTSRVVFHTVWRTDYPKGYKMKVAVAEDKIEVVRSFEPKPNEFLEVDKKSKKTPIQLFAEDVTKTRRITLDEGESLVGTIDRLRAAAKTLTPPLSVRTRFDGTGGQNDLRKTARSFRFELIPQRKPKGTATPAAAVTQTS